MRKGDERKASLLRAAKELFFSRGYAATSVNDILDTQHVSKGSFYHHFESKLEVLTELCKQHQLEAAERYRSAVKDGMSALEKLDLLLDAGRFSPTGSNAQNVSYIVVQKEREAFNSAAMRAFRTYNDPERFAEVYPPPYARDRMDFEDDEFLFKGADTIILTICPRDDNAAIASANMELAANGMGLGMLYVGIFVRLVNRDPSIRKYLGLSEGDHVATALGFGYPDVRYYRTVPRKPARVRWM